MNLKFKAFAVIFTLTNLFAIGSTITARAAETSKSPAFELIALGTGGPSAAGRASSGYILMVDGHARVLVDAGGGSFARLSEMKINLDQLDVVLLTHLHIDDSADVPAIFKARGGAHRGPYSFQVFGPEGAGVYPSVSRWVHLLFEQGGAFAYQPDFNAKETINARDLTSDLQQPPAMIYDAAGIQVTAVATYHGDCPNVAYRISHRGKSVTFSGDMDASALPNLTRLAAQTDLLVFNCVVLDPPDSSEALYELHSPPQAIRMTAKEAGVKQLLLSHMGPDIEKHFDDVKKSIAASYHGPVTMAENKKKYLLAQ